MVGFGPVTAMIFIEFEQEPVPENRVYLTDQRDRLGQRRIALDWRLSETDVRTARALLQALGRELGALDWGRVQIVDWLMDDQAAKTGKWGYSAHHNGTTRMADEPSRGVVDRNCRVFGVENLFIAGASVFPTSGFVNPTETRVALSFRIADHLKSRLV